jgi:anti-anti-sigma factor
VREEIRRLRAELVAWVREARGELVLDASAVRAVDGAGLQLLISCSNAMARGGGSLRLVRCSRALADALALTGQRWGLAP